MIETLPGSLPISGPLPSFNTVVADMGVAATKEMNIYAAEFPGTILLAQGVPSFPTPEHINEAAGKAIADASKGTGKYTHGSGIWPLREAIAEKVDRDNGIKATPEQIIVTHGGIQAVLSTFQTLLNRDDELIVLTPDYPSHFNQVSIATGRKEAAIHVPLTETADDWVLDPQRLEAAVTDHTKAILVTNPCNPTGKVYKEDELREIADVALRHNLFIVTDEMYEYFSYDGRKHTSIGRFSDVADRTISIFGLSKSYAMTGWRVGYIVAQQRTIDQIFKVHDSTVTCATAASQYAGLAAITGDQTVVAGFRNEFMKRRGIVMDELAGTRGLHLALPQGTYYAFPRIEGGVDDKELAMSLVREARVAVVYGSASGKGGQSHLRVSFGGEETDLREGLRRLKGYLNSYDLLPPSLSR